MSGFRALNIESDDESDIEVDDTKEIQIEEALKLYQTALKHHADGPDSFEKAAEAYQQLFDSEIFKYPESQAELQRIDLFGPGPDSDDYPSELPPSHVATGGSGETGPSTLPQILHLSHKNYAQFKLESLISRFDPFNVTLKQVLADATDALNHFVQALDKDDSDLDLWRRAAAASEMLDSKRVARFCLESVLDGDDEGLNGVLALPGLEESFAGEQLRELVFNLQDQLSLLQSPLSSQKRRTLSKLFKQRLSPYDEILRRQQTLKIDSNLVELPVQPQRQLLKLPKTWAELGEALVLQLTAEQHAASSAPSGLAVEFELTEAPISQDLITDRQSSSPQLRKPFSKRNSWMVRTLAVSEQFPGLDNGQPTVQPRIAPSDTSMLVVTSGLKSKRMSVAGSSTTTLPSRKRSGDTAGLHDGSDEGRVKTRRIRTRDSNADMLDTRQAMIEENIRWEYEQKLNEIQAADDWMFETVGMLFEKIGVIGFDVVRHVRQDLQKTNSDSENSMLDPTRALERLRHARLDIHAFLEKYNDQLANLVLNGGESLDLGQSSQATGSGSVFTAGGTSKNMPKLPLMPNDGLDEFIQNVNQAWLLTKEVAWAFIDVLSSPGKLIQSSNSYTHFLWPENLKTIIVRTLVNFDDSIYEQACEKLNHWKRTASTRPSDKSHEEPVDMLQTIFELHLDVYCLIKEPNSGVDAETITSQGDRLQRWSHVAREAIHFRNSRADSPSLGDHLNLRFLWATTFCIGAFDDVTQDHIIECMNDLRVVLMSVEKPTIRLPNNAVMPEISVSTLDREISKLMTRDFFVKVTDQNKKDPAIVIESLEPLLDYVDGTNSATNGSAKSAGEPTSAMITPELVRFLENSDFSLRLLLWQRLRDAYNSIEYQPMVVFCHFRMMRMMLEGLKSRDIAGLPQIERQVTVLQSLRLLLTTVKNICDVVQKSKEALDCIDEDNMKLAIGSLGETLQLLQVFNTTEDSIRVGQSQDTALPSGLPFSSFAAFTNALNDAQIQIWIVLYALLKDAISQNAQIYTTPMEDKFDFLRTVHRNLGIRKICGSFNRAFVRLLKDELFQMSHADGLDCEQAQVLYDLYGLDCFQNSSHDLIEHDCTHDAFIDRSAALQAVDLLIAQASDMPIKDLVKHPLKDAIDKVHGSTGKKKPTEAILRNREIYRGSLRSPIHPLDLINCLRGEGNQLPVTPISKDDALLASKGWYFLMGHIALTKFRSQKRTTPIPIEDVEIAIAFFIQDLEFTTEHWETWFRLAQAYDTKIEESVVWSAEKLNNSMHEIILLQRQAIHCYIMATALAYRSADLAFETSDKMTELCADFAIRLYSSSREPFSMLAFAVDDAEKFLSTSTGINKGRQFQPLGAYTAWKVANVLFQRALVGKPDQWMLHYGQGKCLWKMHSASELIRGRQIPPQGTRVVEAFVRALELLPERDRKESRDTKRDPVLEPHYKLTSIVHKLVIRGSIDLKQAKEALNRTQYATRNEFPQQMDGWIPYILAVLKHLRVADKSNWYHRIIARTAHIIYNQPNSIDTDQDGRATGAKHELTQQMFTKTMVLQVWRPEAERAGRHFVYTSRYTRFFVKILKQLKDRANLEMLAKRVRRRPHDLFEHSLVWQEICTAYLQLLRSFADVAEGLETSTFSNISHDEFLARKEPLEKWMQSQSAGVSAVLDCLREVQDLKKINQSLIKPGTIDDLIGDSYAQLFNSTGKQLLEAERRVKIEEEAQRPPPPAASLPRNTMMSLTHLMNMDGNGDSAPSSQPSVPAPTQSASTQPDQAPARRKVGVGRREIRTCAEACFQKASTQSNAASKIGGASGSRLQILIERDRSNLPGDMSVATSAPGSIHDSADDESELSELEEEGEDVDADEPAAKQTERSQILRPVFPGLAGAAAKFEDSQDTSEIETADEGTEDQMQDTQSLRQGSTPLPAFTQV